MTNSTVFLGLIKQDVKDGVVAECTYMAVGSGTATESPSDTSLGDEVDRNARIEYTEGTDNVVISGWWGSSEANGNDLTEVALANSSSTAEDILSRSTFTAVTKTAGTEVWVDVEEQVSVTQ